MRKPRGVAEFDSPAKRLEWHQSFLHRVAASSAEQENPRLIYSYDSVISGFAAVLSPEQLKAMEGMEGFVRADREQVLSAQTTHTPAFLGLHRGQGLWHRANLGEGVIVGVVDTGVYPLHPSFQDRGLLPPPPDKWRGRCGFNFWFCNNKLIGAISFVCGDQIDRSPVDIAGHGTHVASTAAGMFADGAQILGMDAGIAAGTAPHAHLAVYKVCTNNTYCLDADILAGIDQAIHDGVDVLSISLGSDEKRNFYQSTTAMGTLAAVERGIFVSCAGGNAGPGKNTVANDAPWIMTVGASTTDRAIRATLRLANGNAIVGQTLYQPRGFDPRKSHLLAYPGASGNPPMEFCAPRSLDYVEVSGKFVMCSIGGKVTAYDKGEEVKRAGGTALVLMNQEGAGFTVEAQLVAHPAIAVSYADAGVLREYFSLQLTPQANLEFHGTTFGDVNASAIAYFSSRGPSWANRFAVLKPDIVGPGVDILAAWPNQIGAGSAPYYLQSGTSMATPHLSGIAALLKRVHSDWTPAAIRSAIMTTSDLVNHARNPIADETGNPADVFGMGAGHVNPRKAADPGLVYDLDYGDYLSYLCSLGYTENQVEAVARRPVDCSMPVSADQLNYPSISALIPKQGAKVLTRTVTNVGDDVEATYVAHVVHPQGAKVTVVPDTLVFTALKRNLSFEVTVTADNPTTEFASGMLRWISGPRLVASPIVVVFLTSAAAEDGGCRVGQT